MNDDIIEGVFGFRPSERIEYGFCAPKPIGCGGPITVFKDEKSEREYKISGLCQECQDKIFE